VDQAAGGGVLHLPFRLLPRSVPRLPARRAEDSAAARRVVLAVRRRICPQSLLVLPVQPRDGPAGHAEHRHADVHAVPAHHPHAPHDRQRTVHRQGVADVRRPEDPRRHRHAPDRASATEESQAGMSPQGIGGWLILPMIGLFVFPVRVAISLATDYAPIFRDGIWGSLTTPGSAVYHSL